MQQLKYIFLYISLRIARKPRCTSPNNCSIVTLSTTNPSLGTKMYHHGESSVTNLLRLWKS